MLTKPLTIKEPASGEYVGVAKKDQLLIIPDVSSCLAIIFILPGNVKIAGHVPLFWGRGSDFSPKENAETVLNKMLSLNKQDIKSILMIGDSYNWKHIVDDLLIKHELSKIDHVFIDKIDIENAQLHVEETKLSITNGLTNNTIEYDIDEVIHSENNYLFD